MRRSGARLARLLVAVLAPALLAGAARPGRAAEAHPTGDLPSALAPSAQERRAARGRSIPELVQVPELAWLEKVARALPAESPEAVREPPPWARALVAPELEIPWSRTLLRLLEHLKEDRRGQEAGAGLLRRFGRYRAEVEAALAASGAPRLLAYAALARSGFEPAASAGDEAGGFWMLRPEEARQLGLEVGFWLDGRRDPRAASEAVGRHLAGLRERLGSWPRALAAFYEGEREPALRPLQVEGEAGEGFPETEEVAATPGGRFVAFALALALVGENRALGAGDAEPLPAQAFDQAEVPGGITLATLARAARTDPETIRALNPALLRDRLPPGDQPLAVRVPRGAAAGLEGALRASLQPLDRLATHRLRYGESIDDVAIRLGIPPRDLRRLNAVRDSWDLRPRTLLVLPPAGSINRAAAEEDLPPPEAPFVVGVPEATPTVEGRTRVFYRTVEGDTLAELAEVFGVTVEEIVEWNSLDPLARLQARMLLRLLVPPERPRQDVVVLVPPAQVRVAALGSEEFHALECARRGKARLTVTARAGETLVKIARRFGLAPGDLARVNRFGWSNELPEGHRVVIYSAAAGGDRQLLGRSVVPRRPAQPVPVPKAAAVGKTRQERAAQAARPPQSPPRTKAGGASPGRGTSSGGPKAASSGGGAPGSGRR